MKCAREVAAVRALSQSSSLLLNAGRDCQRLPSDDLTVLMLTLLLPQSIDEVRWRSGSPGLCYKYQSEHKRKETNKQTNNVLKTVAGWLDIVVRKRRASNNWHCRLINVWKDYRCSLFSPRQKQKQKQRQKHYFGGKRWKADRHLPFQICKIWSWSCLTCKGALIKEEQKLIVDWWDHNYGKYKKRANWRAMNIHTDWLNWRKDTKYKYIKGKERGEKIAIWLIIIDSRQTDKAVAVSSRRISSNHWKWEKEKKV